MQECLDRRNGTLLDEQARVILQGCDNLRQRGGLFVEIDVRHSSKPISIGASFMRNFFASAPSFP